MAAVPIIIPSYEPDDRLIGITIIWQLQTEQRIVNPARTHLQAFHISHFSFFECWFSGAAGLYIPVFSSTAGVFLNLFGYIIIRHMGVVNKKI